jgi:hypothetical protein
MDLPADDFHQRAFASAAMRTFLGFESSGAGTSVAFF